MGPAEMSGRGCAGRFKTTSRPNTHVHKYANTQVHKYTSTQIHRYTDTQRGEMSGDVPGGLRQHNAHIHKYTNTQIHKYTSTQVHKYTEGGNVRGCARRFKTT